MQIKRLAPVAFLVLIACSPPGGIEKSPPPPKTERSVFKAFGNEPGWSLEIDDREIRYVGDYGETKITVDKPEPVYSVNGAIYMTPEIRVETWLKICNDTMMDRSYFYAVTISIANRKFQGCGGGIRPPETLEGTNWEMTSNKSVSLQFQDGKISGSTGCNRMNGAFTVEGKKLVTPAIATTKRLCSADANTIERGLLELLSNNPDISYKNNGNMVLTGTEISYEFSQLF